MAMDIDIEKQEKKPKAKSLKLKRFYGQQKRDDQLQIALLRVTAIVGICTVAGAAHGSLLICCVNATKSIQCVMLTILSLIITAASILMLYSLLKAYRSILSPWCRFAMLTIVGVVGLIIPLTCWLKLHTEW